jgi:hypothetical protein
MVQMVMGEQLRESRDAGDGMFSNTPPDPLRCDDKREWPHDLQSGAKCERRFPGHRGCSADCSSQLQTPNFQLTAHHLVHRAQRTTHMHAAPRKRAPDPSCCRSCPCQHMVMPNGCVAVQQHRPRNGAWKLGAPGSCSSRSLCNPGLAHLGPARL